MPLESRHSWLWAQGLQKSRGSERHHGLSGHLALGTLLVARFRRESGDQLCQIVWDWDWAGAKSCCHPLQPQQVMMLGTLTRCLFTPWLDKMWELLKLSLQNM